MTKINDKNKYDSTDAISFDEILVKGRVGLKYLKSKWLTILCFSILGACVGLAYSIFKKPIYTATCTFVLEDGNSGGGLGQYAGLASLAGFDLGGGGGGGGIFHGDNILELYKSRLMIEKALLSNADFDGKSDLLINRYIDFNHLKSIWKKNQTLDKITFIGDPSKFNRNQDSIITDIVENFNKHVLVVFRLDKKLAIIKVQTISTDELFAKQFTNKLVETVNDFYVLTKTKKGLQNVRVLQKQADSVRMQLNNSISGVAAATDASPNANPQLATLRVPSQKRQIDVQANTAIYGEIIKNLEISKVSLVQETPIIQVIDAPVLPLSVDHIGKIKGSVIGFFVGAFLACVGVVFKRISLK
jgi:hypothetical protein